MSKYLEKQLPEEFRVLWDMSKRKKIRDYVLMDQLKHAVRYRRQDLKLRGNSDKLALKLSMYGNAGNWATHMLRDLAREIYNDKRPGSDDLGQWVSVEIECVLPNKRAETNFARFARAQGYGKQVTIKHDGSVHPTEEEMACECTDDNGDPVSDCDCDKPYGKEIVVTFKYGDWTILEKLCAELNRLGATVNKTCGLHVHFDCRHLSPRSVSNAGARLGRTVNALKMILPKSRRNNTYCRLDVNKIRGGDRYAFVNLTAYRKHRTLEVRGHSGTTDAQKIIKWIRILRAIMDKRNMDEISTVVGLIGVMKFDADLAAYIMSRAAKFADPPKPTATTAGEIAAEARAALDDIFQVRTVPFNETDDVAQDNGNAA